MNIHTETRQFVDIFTTTDDDHDVLIRIQPTYYGEIEPGFSEPAYPVVVTIDRIGPEDTGPSIVVTLMGDQPEELADAIRWAVEQASS